MSRVLFLDIDGVVLPGRAYMLPTQTHDPFVTVFDPCAVSMINEACRKQNRKIVLHSSWIRTKYIENYVNGDVISHCVAQGIKREHFHDDPYCDRDEAWRWNRVSGWLDKHPEVDDFFVLDDEKCEADWRWRDHVINTDFDEGITMYVFHRILDGTRPINRALPCLLDGDHTP